MEDPRADAWWVPMLNGAGPAVVTVPDVPGAASGARVYDHLLGGKAVYARFGLPGRGLGAGSLAG